MSRQELVSEALRRLSLSHCPRCTVALLRLSSDPASIACAGGCPGERVRVAVLEASRALHGPGLREMRDALGEFLVQCEPVGDDPAEEPSTSVDARTGRTGSGARFVRAGEIEPREVSWLWEGRLPAGMIAVLDGAPAAGKSSMVCDLVARITTGRDWPGATGDNEPRNVVLVGHEDSPAQTIRPRLDAAGANADRVLLLTDIDGRLPRLPGDADAIEHLVREMQAALLVFDPYSAYIGAADLHRDNEVRSTLAPLATLAERTGTTVLLVRHLRKAGGTEAMYRGLGSVGITALARASLMLLRDPDDPEARILTWPKLSVGPEPKSLRWRFGPSSSGKPPPIEWDATPCDLTANDVLAREDERQRGGPREGVTSKVDQAEQWLMELLEERAEVPAAEILEHAKADGIAEKTLRAAQRRLGIRPRRENDASSRGRGRWIWTAPAFKTPKLISEANLSGNPSGEPSTPATDVELAPSVKMAKVQGGGTGLGILKAVPGGVVQDGGDVIRAPRAQP